MDGMDHLEPTADFGFADEGLTVETRKPSEVAERKPQTRAEFVRELGDAGVPLFVPPSRRSPE